MEKPNIIEKSGGAGKTVLVVEDDQFVCRMVRQNLERAGFRTASAARGVEAIEKINRNPDVLLLLDYQLPDMTAKQVVEELIRSQCKVPFIMMTGQGDERIAVEMMKLGARDYIVKNDGFVDLLPRVVGRMAREVSSEEDSSKTEIRLRESHRSLLALVCNLPGMAYRCRNDRNRTMVFVSKGCAALTGYQPFDLVGNNRIPYMHLLHPADRGLALNNIQTALAQKRPFQLTYRIGTANEGERCVLEKGSGVFSPNGDVRAVEGFITDITDHRIADAILEKRIQELEHLNDELERFADAVSASIGIRGNTCGETLATKMSRHRLHHRQRSSDLQEDIGVPRRMDCSRARKGRGVLPYDHTTW